MHGEWDVRPGATARKAATPTPPPSLPPSPQGSGVAGRMASVRFHRADICILDFGVVASRYAPLGALDAVVRRAADAFTIAHKLSILHQVAVGMTAIVADLQLHRNLVLSNVLLFQASDPTRTLNWPHTIIT